jgi:hypothetical protein
LHAEDAYLLNHGRQGTLYQEYLPEICDAEPPEEDLGATYSGIYALGYESLERARRKERQEAQLQIWGRASIGSCRKCSKELRPANALFFK